MWNTSSNWRCWLPLFSPRPLLYNTGPTKQLSREAVNAFVFASGWSEHPEQRNIALSMQQSTVNANRTPSHDARTHKPHHAGPLPHCFGAVLSPFLSCCLPCQNQGMKINLSLTEMSQFFMKMAEAVKKKKLKPGASIPGCNSYFLCKFLKDTMLQARLVAPLSRPCALICNNRNGSHVARLAVAARYCRWCCCCCRVPVRWW